MIETAGVGKFDKMQQAEKEEFEYCWQQTHSYKEKKIIFVENFWKKVCQNVHSSYFLKKGLLEIFNCLFL